jgi:parvulin-like peptidyl-prolyl isomerase
MKPFAKFISGFAVSVVVALGAQAQELVDPPPATAPVEEPPPPTEPSPLRQPPPRPRPAVPAPPPRPMLPPVANGIAAKVNGTVITINQVRMSIAPMLNQLATQFPRRGPEFERQFKIVLNETLQELIDRQIILDEYKTMGATIKDYYVDEEIKRQVRTLFNGDDAKFQEELRRSRLTMEGYRQMQKEKMIVQAMRAQQFSDAPPPLPDEVRKEYNEIKTTLRDTSKDRISFKKIFLPKEDLENPLATPETQLTLAESLAKQIQQGADFAELAKTHSRDAFAAEGGVQKDVSRLDLSPEFAAILFDTKEGQLSGPLEDRNGYTLAIPTKIVLGPSPPLDGEVRERIEEIVRRKKTSAQYERWIQSRRKKAMIQILIKDSMVGAP